MLLLLRCIRCGRWDRMDPLEVGARFGACSTCCDKAPALTIGKRGRWSNRARLRWAARWQKSMQTHPTYKALCAALDALENTPHGTLAEADP